MTDGLLMIDKPAGITSHDVVDRVRRSLKTKRVGHTGTLDPFATGVMVILVGQATRLAQFLDKDEKEYEAEVQFGWETDTGDKTGKRITGPGAEISDAEPRPSDPQEQFALVNWENVLANFRGELLQVPPMYSAKKIAGKKLYELAREGKEIERQAVSVTIRELELLEHRGSRSTLRMRVVCSAGTYIRTLAEDIGRFIGLGAHLTELRRTRAGKFDLAQALKLEELRPDTPLIPMNEAVGHLGAITLSPERIVKTRNGLSSRTDETFTEGEAIRMIDAEGDLIAIGRYNAPEKVIQPKLVFG